MKAQRNRKDDSKNNYRANRQQKKMITTMTAKMMRTTTTKLALATMAVNDAVSIITILLLNFCIFTRKNRCQYLVPRYERLSLEQSSRKYQKVSSL